MAFPTIPTVAAGRVLVANQANATSPRTFPNLTSLTKNSGDLLIAIIVAYQSSAGAGAPGGTVFSSWGASFTEFCDQMTTNSSTLAIGAAYKWSTGSETGTFTVAQVATITGHASMILLSIPGAHASTPPAVGTIANGTGAAADPGSLDPAAWAAEDTLWIAVHGNGMTAIASTWTGTGASVPSGFSDLARTATVDSSVLGQTELAVAFDQLNASSLDVGTFAATDISNARNSSLTIAVRPIASTAHTVPVNDTLALSDARVMDRGKSLVDTIVMSDSLARTLTQSRAVADAVALLDSLATAKAIAKPLADTVALADNVTIEKSKTLAINDTVAISDARTFARGVGVADGISLLDSVKDAQGLRLGDVVLLADSLGRAVAKARQLADTLALTDSVSIGQGQGLADTVALADSLGRAVVMARQLADTVALSDQLTRTMTKARTLGPDAVALSDARVMARGKVLADSVALSDSLSRVRNAVRTIADTVTLTDNVSPVKSGSGSQAINDLVALSDQLTRTMTLARAFADVVSVADSVVTAKGKTLSLADSVAVSDSFSRAAAVQRALADVVPLSDAQVTSLARAFLFADVVALSDAIELELGGEVFRADSITFRSRPALEIELESGAELEIEQTPTEEGTSISASKPRVTIRAD